jgi:hypothetical protein
MPMHVADLRHMIKQPTRFLHLIGTQYLFLHFLLWPIEEKDELSGSMPVCIFDHSNSRAKCQTWKSESKYGLLHPRPTLVKLTNLWKDQGSI